MQLTNKQINALTEEVYNKLLPSYKKKQKEHAEATRKLIPSKCKQEFAGLFTHVGKKVLHIGVSKMYVNKLFNTENRYCSLDDAYYAKSLEDLIKQITTSVTSSIEYDRTGKFVLSRQNIEHAIVLSTIDSKDMKEVIEKVVKALSIKE